MISQTQASGFKRSPHLTKEKARHEAGLQGEGLIRAIRGAHPAGRACARSKGLSCPFYRTKGSHQGLAAQPNKRKSSAM
ncbi:MAG: hypothetical protein ABW117_14980, partial [Candidatus Sedimenticola sp. 1PA]